MKNKFFLLIFCFVSSFVFAQQTGVRYNAIPEGGGYYQVPNKVIKAATYSATITIVTYHEEEIIQVAQLTGSPTINATVSSCYKGDKLWMQFSTDGSQRTVTFNTHFTANGTLVISGSSTAVVNFIFDGTNWLELSRQSSSSTASLAVNSITENTTGSGVTINKSVIQNYTATTYTATGTYTVTAAQLAGGLLVAATSTVATTMTLPTASALATQISAVAGTSIDFEVLNNGTSNGTVTVAVNTGITASDFPGTNTLTRTGSATLGIAKFSIIFLSATAAILIRTS